MAATCLGTALTVGVGTTLATYIIESIETGNKDVSSTDIKDEDGKMKTRIVKQTMDKISLNLICLTTAVPATDWPVGAKAVATGYTAYYVDSCTITKTEDACKVSVQLTYLGI